MKFLDQAKSLLSKNSSKITDQLDGVSDMIDKKTGGKYTDKINKVTSTVESKLGDIAADETKIDLNETIDTDAAAKAATDLVDDDSDNATGTAKDATN